MKKISSIFNNASFQATIFISSCALGAAGIVAGINMITVGDLSDGGTTLATGILVGGIGGLGLRQILQPS